MLLPEFLHVANKFPLWQPLVTTAATSACIHNSIYTNTIITIKSFLRITIAERNHLSYIAMGLKQTKTRKQLALCVARYLNCQYHQTAGMHVALIACN